MQTALHQVVGTVDVSSSSGSAWWHAGGAEAELQGSPAILQLDQRRDRPVRMPSVDEIDADVHQLAVDLIIELERYQRSVPK